ncbi:MAG: macro domain-containing protein [Candidatus Calescibacterium sp.]|nr:macro domain-containing protein [Candidatus Calescibacterium sp.]
MNRKSIKLGQKVLEIVLGDITNQPDIEAIVNSANRDLKPGGGVSGAIHRRAGPQLYESSKKLAPIKVSQAVITEGFNLPNKYIIHTLGPVFGVDKPESELLKQTYINCIELADKYNIKSIAFPSISTGIFGYPIESASHIAIKTIETELPKTKIDLVRIVLYTLEDYKVYEGVVAQKDRALPS